MTYKQFKQSMVTHDYNDINLIFNACRWFRTETMEASSGLVFNTFYMQPINDANDSICRLLLEHRLQSSGQRETDYVNVYHATVYVYNTQALIQEHDLLYAHMKRYTPGRMSIMAIVGDDIS